MRSLTTLLTAILMAASATSANAQSTWDNTASRSDSQTATTSIFARYSFQPRSARNHQSWQYGLSFAAPARWSPALSGADTFGRDHTTSGVEIRLGEADRGLWSRGSNGQKLASFNMAVDRLDANEGAGPKKTSIGTILLIGGAVVGGLILISAASSDNAPLLCTGNTIPNPIKGTCEPI